MMKVHLRMLGCRLNQAEIDQMARQFQQQGLEIVEDPGQADHIIVNTCAVTHSAVRSGKRLLRDLHSSGPNAEITVTGCQAQLMPEDIRAIPGVKRIISNDQKDKLVETITGKPTETFDLEPFERSEITGIGRTRAFIKVQDGCDNACTFCVTTVARGEGRSRSTKDIISEIRQLHEIGYQEAILTGVHLGSYGHDLGDDMGLRDLVQRILNETDIPRVRMSSLEPWDLSPEFFDLWQDPRLCPHLHLPLQSGCDSTLRRMRRNTDTKQFRQLMHEARSRIADVRITSDIIVGFPGETDEEFEQSEAFVREMDFAGLHVFQYSRRPGTPAARMRGQVQSGVRKERSKRLLELSTEQETRFASRFTGRSQEVLWEQIAGATEAGFINNGYTANYLRVQCIHPRPLTNLITDTLLGEVAQGVMQAKPVIE